MADIIDFDHPAMKELDACKFLMTQEIRLHSHTLLEVTVGEGIVGNKVVQTFEVPDVNPLKIEPESKRFTFIFRNFVSYAVTEEMFWKRIEETFVATRGGFGQASASPFLDFVRATTWAENYPDRELFHYKLGTLDHTIDVVTQFKPEFTFTWGSSSGPQRPV